MNKANLRSPLRYPGSKALLMDYFASFVTENLLVGAHLHEPYAGGASISLGMLERGLVSKASIVERDPLIYAFWKIAVDSPDELCQRIDQVPVTLETWRSFQRYLGDDALLNSPLIDLALAGLFFNRTNFSGIVGAKPIGGLSQSSKYTIGCRFNKLRLCNQIRSIGRLKGRLHVFFGDGLTYLKRRKRSITNGHSLVYVDPPYFQQGPKLYRYHFKERDHFDLANHITSQQYPWIISYDNHPVIRRLFSGQQILPIQLNYVVKQSRRAEELLIANRPLAQPVYRNDCQHRGCQGSCRFAA